MPTDRTQFFGKEKPNDKCFELRFVDSKTNLTGFTDEKEVKTLMTFAVLRLIRQIKTNIMKW